jgi:hypothetical protein
MKSETKRGEYFGGHRENQGIERGSRRNEKADIEDTIEC